jgi:outer membrane lipoprotein-sorting protein
MQWEQSSFMITNRRFVLSLLFASAVFSLTRASMLAQPKPGHLDEVIRQMDAASEKFQSAEADFRWDLYEKVVKETTTQTGTIFFKRQGGTTIMGARMTSPSLKIMEFRNNALRLFEPGTDHLTTVNATKNKALFESFLTNSFGGSGKDLLKSWRVTDLGDEVIDGVTTAKLDLFPKDPTVLQNCTHMTIWVDPVHGVQLKQSLYMPSGDYRTAVYTNIRYNQKIDEKLYEIKTDSKTTRDEH